MPDTASEPEYGRLELRKPIPLSNGKEGKEIIIYRPTCGAMTEVLDLGLSAGQQVQRFCDSCCRAVNGLDTDPQPFSAAHLLANDSAELGNVINAMSEDADAVTLDDRSDGITAPLIYTLQHPIKMSANEDADVIEQLQFEARTVGEVSEYLDIANRGETREFATFMRLFGTPLGVKVPIMSDSLIGALDFLDYLVIRRQVMPRFLHSRNRWKRASSPVPSRTGGRRGRGTS